MGSARRYNDEYHPAWVRSLVAAGHGIGELSAELGIDEGTFREWSLNYPNFAEAVDFGQKIALAKVEHSMFQRALGYEYTETDHTEEDMPWGTRVKDVTRRRQMAPDVAAQKAFLTAYNSKRWGPEAVAQATIGMVTDETGDIVAAPSINITFTVGKKDEAKND